MITVGALLGAAKPAFGAELNGDHAEPMGGLYPASLAPGSLATTGVV